MVDKQNDNKIKKMSSSIKEKTQIIALKITQTLPTF